MNKQPLLILALLCLFQTFNLSAQVFTGNVTLNTQAEVDAFPVDNPGIIEITGSLRVIGPDIVDLSALNNLERVSGILSVAGCNNLIEIDDFTNLATCEKMSFFANQRLKVISGFPNLTIVDDGFSISTNDSLTTISGFGMLTSVEGRFSISSNALVTVTGFTNITTGGGDFEIGARKLPSLSFLSNLTQVARDFSINGNDNITNLNDLQNLTTVGNVLELSGLTNVSNFDGLSGLTSVGFGYDIGDNPLLENIDIFSNVTITGLPNILISRNPLLTSLDPLSGISGNVGRVIIRLNNAITDLTAFSGVTKALGDVYISEDGITGLEGFENITSFNRDFTLDGCANLQSTAALTSLTNIGGTSSFSSYDAQITNNPMLQDVDFLSLITQLNAGIQIQSNGSLANLAGMSNITFIRGSVYLRSLNLQSLAGLENLETIGVKSNHSLTILSLNNLQDMTGLNSLTTVTGRVRLISNSSVVSLNGLNNLTSIGSNLELFDYGSANELNDVSALANLTSVGGNLNVNNNENLDECCIFLNLINTPGAIGGATIIENNSTNCNSVADIQNWCEDGDGDSFTGMDGDCDNTNDQVFPGAPEVCDGLDNDCNGDTDEGVQITCYQDMDEDGFGNPDSTTMACSCPEGYVLDNTDCNDESSISYPGAPEVCDGLDNNCNGDTDEGVQITCYQDMDGDDFGNPDVSLMACSCPENYVLDNTDCNDEDITINPAAIEICDGIDNNCNGLEDEGVQITCYQDMDGDGFGNPDETTMACSCPEGYVLDNTDCNDDSEISYPGAVEICDGLDNNCDGDIDENGICYCDSYGESTMYEWIESIDVNGTTNASGDDGGYANYTSSLVLPLSTGYNNLQLNPGFSGNSYREYWSVWVDFNQDDDFDDYGELVYYASSFNSVYGDFYVPSSAMTGTTRMRISMRYGNWSNPCSIFAEGEVEDYLVDISFCDNIVDGGEIGDDEILCDGNTSPATMYNVADAAGGSGDMEYLWLMSTTTSIPPNYSNMNEWIAIPNSNTTSYTAAAISETTWYIRCARRNGCIEYTGESNVIEKTVQEGNCIPDHCASEGLSTEYEWIKKVKLGSINNFTGNDGGYGDYTNLSTSLWTAENLTITLKPGFSGSSYLEYWRVWIDWNQDGDFDDSGELEVQTSGYGARYKTISVPADAMLGNTRMRVSMKYGDYASPCETFSEGEVEDYTINVMENSQALVVLPTDEKDRENERGGAEAAEEKEDKAKTTIAKAVTVYPNPAIDQLFINLENYEGRSITIKLHNSLGQVLQIKEIASVSNSVVEFPVSRLQHGNYLLTIQSEEEVISKQVIIGK